VDDQVRTDDARPSRHRFFVWPEYGNRPPGVRDHDLLAGPDAPDQLAEKGSRVVRVVLSKAAAVSCLDQAALSSLT
jgi:hypothetical protein